MPINREQTALRIHLCWTEGKETWLASRLTDQYHHCQSVVPSTLNASTISHTRKSTCPWLYQTTANQRSSTIVGRIKYKQSEGILIKSVNLLRRLPGYITCKVQTLPMSVVLHQTKCINEKWWNNYKYMCKAMLWSSHCEYSR